jgi:hypothetical protein
MSFGRKSLVGRMQERLEAPWTCDGDGPSVERDLAEVERRVGRLRRLGSRFSAVKVSEHITGLRAASVPDRSVGVASPGRV